jgi:metal-sulfur cluster biosynthetic enzyme
MAIIIVMLKMEKSEITKASIEDSTIEMLKSVFDPEIPVNVYDLGMIYKIDVVDTEKPEDEKLYDINIDMTFTAPNCPAADFIIEDINQKLGSIHGVNNVNVEVVFEPEWNKDMMTEEAKLDLGFM